MRGLVGDPVVGPLGALTTHESELECAAREEKPNEEMSGMATVGGGDVGDIVGRVVLSALERQEERLDEGTCEKEWRGR
jgi:hypothetical protein